MAIDENQHAPAVTRTFLIADVRGYTAFTREHGDAAAGRLAARFAGLAREAAAARGGEVLELRGDEALAVFASPEQAVRAAVELLDACAEETAADPTLPLTVGVGVDVGEAVPVEGGYRGTALNTAARLCSKAVAGEVLVSRAVAEATGRVEGLRLEDRGSLELKGFDAPVDAVGVRGEPPQRPAGEVPEGSRVALPLELDTFTPLVGRADQLRWLRGTWRLARRGRGRLLFLSGPAGIGKTRLVAELASEVHGRTGVVRYAGAGGAGTALALGALRDAMHATSPTLVVLDDLDVLGVDVVTVLGGSSEALQRRPVMVVATFRDAEGLPALASLVERTDVHEDAHRTLPPLDAGSVHEVGRLYAGHDVDDLPLESVIRASGGVPARVHETLSDWARNEAGRRLEAAAGYLAAGRSRRSADLAFANNVIALKLGRLYRVQQGAAHGADGCPYKGLDPFRAEDAAYFFGRERLVGELAARTVGAGLLGVVGASGSGKSSAVMAGLVPSLSAGLLPGSDRWRALTVRPGAHPIRELRLALTAAGFEVDGEDPLAHAIRNAEGGSRIVLILDQFEELFAGDVDPEERRAFLRSLADASEDPERFVAVPTLRGDFYAHLADHAEVAQLFAENHVLLGPMSADELRRAIELPARRAGMHVEAALTDALIADVEEEPGGLPLLSTALVELWGAREAGWLTLEAYERSGGVRGAVARLAERSFERLSDAERQAARRVLLRLVGTGEGDSPVRRRVPTNEFDLERDVVAHSVLARFTQDRLLTQSDGWVEVAHEALIREWPRLADWLEEDLEGHRLRAHLTQAASRWDREHRDPGELFRGARLSATLDWASAHAEELNQLERTFLTESRQASEREAERHRRTNRRLRALLAGVAVLLVVALVAGGLAVVQRARAERERQVAFARELTYAAAASLRSDPERSILLAMEAVRTYRKASAPVGKDALETLHGAVQASGVALTLEHPSTANAAFSPDGGLIATGGSLKGTNQYVAAIWDARTGEFLHELEGHTGDINDLNFSPDGSLLATVGADRTANIWDPTTGERLRTLTGHTADVQGVSFSNDGSLLATSGWDGTLRLWDVASGRQVRSITIGEGLCYNGFSPDDAAVAVGHCYGDTGTIWSVESGRRLVTLEGHGAGVVGVSFDPDGGRVATGSLDGTIGIWDAKTGERLMTLEGHRDWVFATPFSPDGDMVASASTDGTARVWDARTGEVRLILAGHGGPIGDVAWSPDGSSVITGGADATAKVRPVTQDRIVLIGHDGPVPSVSFSADGSRLVTAGSDETARLWDARSGEEIERFEDPNIAERFTPTVVRVGAVAVIASDGSRLVTAGGPPAVWDVSTGRRVISLDPKDDASSYPSAAFSRDERLVAVGGSNGTATLFEARTGRIIRTFEHSDQPDLNAIVFDVAFSPGGSLLATASGDGTAKVWSVETGELMVTFRGHESQVLSVDFSQDGRSIVTSSQDGVAKIWEARTGRELVALRGHAGVVWDAEFVPDGPRVATAGADKTVRVWDASNGQEVLTLAGHTLPVVDVDLSPDGGILVSASDDGTVRLYHLRLDDLMRVAAERVSRSFSEAECRRYLHVETCPRAT
jgi:WD40 repeat protein/class 3 adenylate cyclase